MVLNAIYALSARHLGRTAAYSSLSPLLYQEKCLALLLPILGSPNVEKDQTAMVTTCILRCFEEIDSPSPTEDFQHHLLGTSLLLQGPNFNLSSETGSVRHTIVWCHLRQEIYVSFALQQPMKFDLDSLDYDITLPCTDDISWSNRMVWFCVKVLRWAFSEQNKLAEDWETLRNAVATWETQRPQTFNPTFRRDADAAEDRLWPDVWFAEVEHSLATISLTLAKVVLIIHDPTLPRMGYRAEAATAKIKGRIQLLTRELCGIAMSNDFDPTWNAACTLINTLGPQFITDPKEQMACLKFLEVAEVKSGWPTQVNRGRLKREWKL